MRFPKHNFLYLSSFHYVCYTCMFRATKPPLITHLNLGMGESPSAAPVQPDNTFKSAYDDHKTSD
jgi:hypothetical protein